MMMLKSDAAARNKKTQKICQRQRNIVKVYQKFDIKCPNWCYSRQMLAPIVFHTHPFPTRRSGDIACARSCSFTTTPLGRLDKSNDLIIPYPTVVNVVNT